MYGKTPARFLSTLSNTNKHSIHLTIRYNSTDGKKIVKKLPKTLDFHPETPAALKQFFPSNLTVFRDGLEYGRGWRLDELRLKNSEDLHKLWYILLKEKNMLLTMQYEALQLDKMIKRGNRKRFVILAMEHIKTIIKEREESIIGAIHLQETTHKDDRVIISENVKEKPTLLKRILKFFKMN
ncbi:39S ribosomal protein L47, mitochondrial [Oopsacas minuta]|uniref:Large ribosomal subunit protein uL29m n=1 Tax=Oopsacas minuta TaxID=111878 RepID=A0AAV7KGP1_9METZ|nr:39S ribosomal protein L47, mitochondrial [Oopsacas minuta]